MNNYNTETYEKLLEDIEDYMVGSREDTDMILFRMRDLLRYLVSKEKSCAFKRGDIVTDGANTVILLKFDPEYNVAIAYSALKNNVLLFSRDNLVHYHKVGHMCPIKIMIHNEEENS